LFFAVIGIVFMLFAMKFPYRNWKRFSPWLFVSSIAFLIIVLFLAKDIKGSHRWINFGFFNFQPSEYAKLSIILLLAHYISEIKKGITNFSVGVVFPLIFVGGISALVLAGRDLGTTIVIFMTFMIMIFAAGAQLSHLSFLGLLGASAAAVLVYIEPYRFERLGAFLNPWKDQQDTGWQIIQSLYALGSGGPFGMGLGMSRQKFNYLPEAHTDYIFAILGEELGLLGTVTVIILFFLLAWRGYKIALTAKDVYGKVLATGLTSYLIFQALLNIGVVTSSIPVTGITLPFLSYGGSSLMISLFSVGILLNISKNTE
jgi:cell division protein FtsW